jgi:hypothetical protein
MSSSAAASIFSHSKINEVFMLAGACQKVLNSRMLFLGMIPHDITFYHSDSSKVHPGINPH